MSTAHPERKLPPCTAQIKGAAYQSSESLLCVRVLAVNTEKTSWSLYCLESKIKFMIMPVCLLAYRLWRNRAGKMVEDEGRKE